LIKPKKHLNFTALRQAMTSHFDAITDHRQSGKCTYSQSDILMSAFACMYFQQPSLLQFQEKMQEGRHENNCRTLFGIEKIPQDSQLREVLDNIPSDSLAPVFKDFFSRLRRHKHLEDYAILPNVLMCSIDGTQYYSSKKIHCDHCLHKEHKTGEKTYSHAVLQGAIMHPDKKQVIPVMPEAIQNSDSVAKVGTLKAKQDCETKAAKRFIERLKSTYPRQRFLICGDGLMSHQPLIKEVLAKGMHYIFVCKPGDHQYLFEWLNDYPKLPSLEITDKEGRTHQYRWQNNVPLHGQENAILVNYFEHKIINSQGKVTSTYSWITDIEINEKNIIKMVKAGRCRWKIENECFNTLKNQGYHLEHNYGHGQQYLSYNMYLLTLLAFYCHQIFELTDKAYQACRERYGSKQSLWETLRVAIQFFIFNSWEALLNFLLMTNDEKDAFIKNM
jgi:hypothetical protein